MLIPKGAHILVVDGARMVLLRNKGRDLAPQLELIAQERDIVPRTSEIGTDQPGRGFQSSGHHRAAYEQTDFHQFLEERFAVKACATLEAALSMDEAEAILIAAPRVLGQLRKQLKPETRRRVIAEIAKDYAGRTTEEIEKLLGDYEHS